MSERFLVWSCALLFAVGCGGPTGTAEDDHGHEHADEADAHTHEEVEGAWAVTAWSSAFEIFAEGEPIVAGRSSGVLTHVTVLDGFAPLGEGVVSIVLRDDAGDESVFRRDRTLRDGIFELLMLPSQTGEFDLIFRVEGAGRTEDVAAGRVRVGTEDDPGRLLNGDGDASGLETVSFLKEQQWTARFATGWAEVGRIRETARGTGRVRPAAGGELQVTAPIDGIVVSEPWPHVGLARTTGETVMALTSRVSQGRTLSELEAVETEKRAALSLARERLERLEGLVEMGAVSTAEVDAARARVETLEAQAEAVRRQMDVVRGGDASGARPPVLEVTAPFTGEVAEILVGPGQAVSAGDPLVRLVRVEPVWVEVHLAPHDADRLRAGVQGLWVRATGDRGRTLFEDVGLVAVAPEVSPRTGRVSSLVRVATGTSRLRLGAAIEAEILLAEGAEGIVVPVSAVVDDAGVPVVFVQLDGETFERHEIEVRGREGDRLLVEGITAGERVVIEGGSTIRRASLVSSGGAGHGHVH
jgi:RND family efflux transporter MFP subunit